MSPLKALLLALAVVGVIVVAGGYDPAPVVLGPLQADLRP